MLTITTDKPFRAWYQDGIGLTNTIIYSCSKKAAEKYFNTYYRGYKLVNMVEQ